MSTDGKADLEYDGVFAIAIADGSPRARRRAHTLPALAWGKANGMSGPAMILIKTSRTCSAASRD